MCFHLSVIHCFSRPRCDLIDRSDLPSFACRGRVTVRTWTSAVTSCPASFLPISPLSWRKAIANNVFLEYACFLSYKEPTSDKVSASWVILASKFSQSEQHGNLFWMFILLASIWFWFDLIYWGRREICLHWQYIAYVRRHTNPRVHTDKMTYITNNNNNGTFKTAQ